MICGKTYKEYMTERERWRRVFIIFPRRLRNGHLVFMQHVYKREHWCPGPDGFWSSEYRA